VVVVRAAAVGVLPGRAFSLSLALRMAHLSAIGDVYPNLAVISRPQTPTPLPGTPPPSAVPSW
jgi:hypothetical protein